LQSRSYQFLLLVLGLGILSGWLFTVRQPNYGLDIRGGVRLTYSMDTSQLTPEQRQGRERLQKNIQQTLDNRARGALGATEPNILTKGTDQFIVELPGYTDETKAREVLSTTASILWYHAKTVQPGHGNSARGVYVTGEQKTINGRPAYTFYPTGNPTKEIAPGTPEYLAMIKSWGEPILRGDDLKSADAVPQGDSFIPSMQFTSAGARKLDAWSRRVMNQGEQLAAVLDDRVISIAPLKDNTILSDNAQIDGKFDPGYVTNLVELLRSGSLPVSLKLESAEKVDPTIGGAALDKMVIAGVTAFGLIGLFLIVYYAFPGVIALIALLLYILFTLTLLKLLNATFSLAGIAGFILSVGMAVDANILVFERFKEEMKNGKTLQQAIELGFRRALPAIVDSNACTILTSLVLATLGTGAVKGFATTLIAGVAISLFTAVVVTRSLLMFFVGSGIASNPKWYAVERNWFGEKFEEKADTEPLRIVESSRKWFLLSGLTIIPGLIFIFMGGIKPNVEFRGGYEAEYAVGNNSLTGDQIQQNLEKNGLKGSTVKFSVAGLERRAIISVPPLPAVSGVPEQAVAKIAEAAGFQGAVNKGFTQIGPAVQQEMLMNAIWGVIISSILIILYLAFRFGVALGNFSGGLRFGFSAIGALVHDVALVIGFAAFMGFILNWEISALFITAMLTIIGFSVHDTIVIFDRIRENLRRPQKGEEFGHLVDRSITRSFARSINTSMTVIATLLILAIFGTATIDLKFFVVTMLVGILSGTYSSIYNASPILYLWDKAVGKRKGVEHTLVGIANHEVARTRVVSTEVDSRPAAATAEEGGRTYGQVRRRANAVSKSKIELDD
jgi:SecD/SecF fusion protein